MIRHPKIKWILCIPKCATLQSFQDQEMWNKDLYLQYLLPYIRLFILYLFIPNWNQIFYSPMVQVPAFQLFYVYFSIFSTKCIIHKFIYNNQTKIIFIESIARVNNLSFTGKIIYYFKWYDLFFVQWAQLKKMYSNVEYLGRLF